MPPGPESRWGLSKGVLALRSCAGLRTCPQSSGQSWLKFITDTLVISVLDASLSCSRSILLAAWKSFERGRLRPLPCSRLALGTRRLGSSR